MESTSTNHNLHLNSLQIRKKSREVFNALTAMQRIWLAELVIRWFERYYLSLTPGSIYITVIYKMLIVAFSREHIFLPSLISWYICIKFLCKLLWWDTSVTNSCLPDTDILHMFLIEYTLCLLDIEILQVSSTHCLFDPMVTCMMYLMSIWLIISL